MARWYGSIAPSGSRIDSASAWSYQARASIDGLPSGWTTRYCSSAKARPSAGAPAYVRDWARPSRAIPASYGRSCSRASRSISAWSRKPSSSRPTYKEIIPLSRSPCMRCTSSGPPTLASARSARLPARSILPARRQAFADCATHLREQRMLVRATEIEGHLAPGDDLISVPEQHVVVQPAREPQRQLQLGRLDRPLMGSTKIAQLPVNSRDPLGLIRAAKTGRLPVRRSTRSGERVGDEPRRPHRRRPDALLRSPATSPARSIGPSRR